MYYSNFDAKITEKHGIIVKNWPLPMFCSPSEVKTRVELNLLHNAWKSGTAHFYKMTRQEFDVWQDEQFHNVNQMDTVDHTPVACNPIDDMVSMVDPADPATSTLPAVPATMMLSNVANTVVTGKGGSTVFVTRKPRKTRSDKGVPRKK